MQSLIDGGRFHWDVSVLLSSHKGLSLQTRKFQGDFLFEHPSIFVVLNSILFTPKVAFGRQFSRLFNPISVPTLAFIVTMASQLCRHIDQRKAILLIASPSQIEIVLSEWSTGSHIAAKLDEQIHVGVYKAWVRRILDWC